MNLFRDEAGQAITEYVLMLVIVLSVFLGGLYQMNTAFKVWADNYFGEYLSCLLESGELPALGGEAGDCNQSFKPFDFANGRPAVISSDSGSTETGVAGNGQSSKSNVKDQSTSSGSSAIAQVLPVSSPSFESASQSRRFRAAARAGDEEVGGNTGSAQITDLSDGQSGKVVRIPLRDVGENSGWAKRVEEEDDKKDKTQVKAAMSGVEQKNTSKLIRIERKIAATQKIEIEEFTFGKFLRILLIAAIVIAIVFFVGGQLMQVSKSLD